MQLTEKHREYWRKNLVITAILGLIGVSRIQKGTPPVPEQAIREAKLTTDALKADGHE